jgi:hypothetical protein
MNMIDLIQWGRNGDEEKTDRSSFLILSKSWPITVGRLGIFFEMISTKIQRKGGAY